jgi:hypothetical protein
MTQRRHSAWRCAPADDVDLADTPLRWTLGKTACLQVLGGRHGPELYRTCEP